MKFEDFKDGVYRNQVHAGGLFGFYELPVAEEHLATDISSTVYELSECGWNMCR